MYVRVLLRSLPESVDALDTCHAFNVDPKAHVVPSHERGFQTKCADSWILPPVPNQEKTAKNRFSFFLFFHAFLKGAIILKKTL